VSRTLPSWPRGWREKQKKSDVPKSKGKGVYEMTQEGGGGKRGGGREKKKKKRSGKLRDEKGARLLRRDSVGEKGDGESECLGQTGEKITHPKEVQKKAHFTPEQDF